MDNTNTYNLVTVRFIQFSLLLLFGILSLICALFIIYNAIKMRSFRARFQNQTLIVLVCIILLDLFINLSITLSYYARGYVPIQTELFCKIWRFFDYIFTATTVWCKALFSIERYILVFHTTWLRSKQQRFFLHHLPLIIINIYLPAFYAWSNFISTCSIQSNYFEHLCGDLCIDDRSGASVFNWVFNILFPTFIVIGGSLVLLIRVLWKRREMQRSLRNWSKNWKMIIQLLGIASVYAIVWLPLGVVSLATTFFYTNSVLYLIEHYLYFASYICELAIPIVVLFLAPELMQKIRGHMRPSTVDIGSITIRQYSNH